MNCEKYLLLIDDLVENELDEATADQVTLHLVDCENCTAHFEMLERERKIYSHYLFEVEPPAHLLANFQAKLEAEKPTFLTACKSNFSNIFAFLRFNPTLVTATVISIFAVGFTLFSLMTEKQKFYQPIAGSVPTGLPGFHPALFTGGGDVATTPTPQKPKVAPKTVAESNLKPIAVKQPIFKKAITAPPIKELSDQEKEIAMIKSFEIETGKQLEKVELLLRSFRNARMIEGSEIYDISYERQQARKLLQNNVALREKAGIYGTMFAEEMLGKVEPYLLDIANLEMDSSPEQVQEIKERVRSQNIIASLQGF